LVHRPPSAGQATQFGASQTHLLLLHLLPSEHCGPLPHMQAPPSQALERVLEHWLPPPQWHRPALQLSARPALHTVQVPPSLPHALTVLPPQLLPEQQPLEQVLALHTQLPPEHCWPATHAAPAPQAQPPSAPHALARAALHIWQLPPSMPQSDSEGASHMWLVSQHPLAQLVLSQTQPPPVQCWPAMHAAPPLHWH
jgi:hypothetical protein